ncbi:MAG: hypothetical protein ACRDPM_14485 [Solirubrobacteraceae bacterium]
MTSLTTLPPSGDDIRELDHRCADGIDVTLLWDSLNDRVLVAVDDARNSQWFTLDVPPADALDAFHHPYAYPRREHDVQILSATDLQ